MATLAQLVVKLITDVTEFTGGLDKASSKLTKFGSEMTRVGTAMTAGVTLPLVAAGAAAVNYASDLEETRNKTAVVFGSMSDSLFEFASDSATALGMSQNAALSYAGTYGSILSNMGMSAEQTAEMSKSLTQLTADYASFHNLKPEEAFEKIKAGLVGSSEPLIALGKDLRVAAVQAYAMENGITSNAKAMSNSELALARYGLLLSQSEKEMGDFARTSDGLANSTRTFKAQMEDTLASFGEILIPTVTTFLQALTPILKWFNDLPRAAKQGIVYMAMFAAAIGPIITAGGALVKFGGWVIGLFGSEGSIATAVTWLSAKLPLAIGAVSKAAAGLAAAIGGISLPVVGLIAALAALVVVIVVFGKQAANTVSMLATITSVLAKRALADIGAWIQTLVNGAVEAAKRVADTARVFYQAGRAIMAGLINGVISYAASLVAAVLNSVNQAISGVRNLLGIHSRSTVFANIGKNMMLGLAQGIDQYAKTPINATVNATTGTVPAVSKVGGGGGRSISIGEIRIFGDLGEETKKKLREEIRAIADGALMEAMA